MDSLLNPGVEPVAMPDGVPVAVPDGVHFAPSDPDADPREEDPAPVDDRTRPQKLHDALETILGAAARGGELPDLGGAAPTLVVPVNAADYLSGTGWAPVGGADAPVSMRVAAQKVDFLPVRRLLPRRHSRVPDQLSHRAHWCPVTNGDYSNPGINL